MALGCRRSRPSCRSPGSRGWLRVLLSVVVGAIALAAHKAHADDDFVYTWPDETEPTFADAQCTGVGTFHAGVGTYAGAQAACEAEGAANCQGVMFLGVAGFWYTCTAMDAVGASTFTGFVPVLSRPVRESNPGAYRDWHPRPASALSSTARVAGQQQAGCIGKFQGSACTERVCAYGLSSNASPFLDDTAGRGGVASDAAVGRDNMWTPGSNDHTGDTFNGGTRALRHGGMHAYAECSGRGVCDRATGTCQCFEGYTGKGCRRTQCANDCSGHGVCSRNVDANTGYAPAGAPAAADGDTQAGAFGSQFWDGHKTMRCVCDRGFEGPDCSLRVCPHGDDVLTTCASDTNHDTQVVAFTDPGGAWMAQQAAAGAPLFYTLTFTDHFGGRYTTRPVVLTANAARNARDAQLALEALPNSAVPSVQVSADATQRTVTVSFTDPATSGLQNTLGVTVQPSGEACAEGGHVPLVRNSAALDAVAAAVVHQALADTDSSYEENSPCGNRGICDSSVGKCTCFEGHTGEACGVQSVYV